VPVVMLITAAIYGLASIATFALLRERATSAPESSAVRGGGVLAVLPRLAQTWRQAQRYRDLRRLLICCACYQAGISAVITLAAVYAEQVLGFKQAATMLLVFMVNVAAVAGAFTCGYWQDRVGHKRTLAFILAGWVLMTLLAGLATGPALFWVAAVIAGLCMGSSQSAGRAMVGLLTPSDRRAEFFGLWSFAIQLSVGIGPLTYGLITMLTGGNHRIAILSTSLFFVVGLWLLRPVDMARGQRAAHETE
jgi:UMF1 family MFS transporter